MMVTGFSCGSPGNYQCIT